MEKENWHEDDRAWRLQEEYLTELSLAHPCGPESLAGLARSWRLADLRADLERDLAVDVGQKVYIRTVMETFERDQMGVFLNSIGEDRTR